MATMFTKMGDIYNKFDKMIDHRHAGAYFFESPVPIVVITCLYFYFIYYGGRKYMEHRKPYDLKSVILVYNLLQIAGNFIIFFKALENLHYFYNITCLPMDSVNPELTKLLVRYCRYYIYLKVADYMDTVFFVLRKKYTHVSFLHVYHHMLMAICGWLVIRISPGGQLFYLGFLNSFIHVLMYTYYTLAAYDSTKGLVLRYKKYITQLQLLQFLILFVIFGVAAFQPPHCTVNRVVVYLCLTQAVVMTALFANFYHKAYIVKNRVKDN